MDSSDEDDNLRHDVDSGDEFLGESDDSESDRSSLDLDLEDNGEDRNVAPVHFGDGDRGDRGRRGGRGRGRDEPELTWALVNDLETGRKRKRD